MEVWSLSELLRWTGNTNKESEDFIPVLHLCQHTRVCVSVCGRDEIQRRVVLSVLDLILRPVSLHGFKQMRSIFRTLCLF